MGTKLRKSIAISSECGYIATKEWNTLELLEVKFDYFIFSIIFIFHRYFGIRDKLLSLNPSALRFVHPGLECREPWLKVHGEKYTLFFIVKLHYKKK